MTTTLSRRTLLSLSALLAASATTGCFGSFAATRKLWQFNDEVSSNKWIKWLLFLGLIILPVYSLFALGDALIFNTIEFFSGSNPIARSTRDLADGTQLAFARDASDPDLVRIEHLRDGRVLAAFFVKRAGDSFTLMDDKRAVIAVAREDGGRVVLEDGAGNVLLELSADDLKRHTASISKTGSPELALQDIVSESRAGRVASSGAARSL